MTSPLVSALAWTAALAWGQAASQPEAARISQAAAQLGDSSFAVRQQATEELWRAGSAAEEELRRALKSRDPEVRTRAAAVLHRLRLGIRPETPADALVLIDQFLYSKSPQDRQRALAELQSKVDLRLLFNLIRAESGKPDGPLLSALVAAETGKLLRPLLEQGRLDEAQELLELLATSDQGLSQLAAFLLITGRLDEHIELVRRHFVATNRDEDVHQLSYFLRAKGDLSAAASAAQRNTDGLLRAKALAAAQRWEEAAQVAADVYAREPTRYEAAALAATYHRLAGNDKAYEQQIAALSERAEESASQEEKPPEPGSVANASPSVLAWTLAETLLINEEPSRALELLKKNNPAFAHAILWRQHRHAEALSLCNIVPGKTLDQAWLSGLPSVPGQNRIERMRLTSQFQMAVQLARQLRELGQTEQVDEILKTLRAVAAMDNDQGARWMIVAQADLQLGKYDDLGRDAAKALAAGASPAALFTRIVKPHGSLAASWYTILLDRDPGMDRAKAVEQAVWIVVAQPPAGRLPDDWRKLVDEAYAKAALPSAQSKRVRLLLLAETCLIRGDRDLARRFFGELAENDSAAALKLGDLDAAAGEWAAAAGGYEKAAAASSENPLAIFLHGYALSKSGQAEAGAARMKLASLLVLAPETRQALAAGLQERGLKAEAAEQFDIVGRVAAPDSSAAVNSAQQAGIMVSAEQPERAADAWQQLLLHVLSPSTNFTEVEGYLNLPHLVHRLRARALLGQSKPELAIAELEQAAATLPSDVRLIVEFVPRLDRAAQSAAADKLFEQALSEHRRVCQEFPQSATYFNNAAWLAARSQRKLDEALALVTKAIELAPSEAAYRDTLAEVQFQRGDRDAAVAAARKALELSAGSKLFAARLKHFENDELKTLDGTEAESN